MQQGHDSKRVAEVLKQYIAKPTAETMADEEDQNDSYDEKVRLHGEHFAPFL